MISAFSGLATQIAKMKSWWNIALQLMTNPKIFTSILLFYQVLLVKTNPAMGRHCILCDNSAYLSLHVFSQDRLAREAWCEHIKRKLKHWMGPRGSSFLCSSHFVQECFTDSIPKRCWLNRDALPTLPTYAVVEVCLI